MRLTFEGADDEVTGSCHLLEHGETKVLIDCGMFQGERMCGDKNFTDFGFDPKEIDAVVITHPHADHTGRLPRLVELGFSGPVYATEPCVALTKLVLEDAFHVMSENAERCHDKVLYQMGDLEKSLTLCHPVGYHEAFKVGDLSFMLHEAGHVLGSAFVSVEAEGKRVIFSGDIGNDDVPILPPTEPISHADYVVCESTYGGRTHEPASMRGEMLKKAVVETLASGGTLLIPAFSIERTQELLYELDKILPTINGGSNIPIFLDSPLSIKATDTYRHYAQYLKQPNTDFFSFPSLHETLSVDESKHINDTPAPKVIIAGSGMMTGGRILHHLIRVLPDAKSTLLIIGYQAAGTLGRTLYEGAHEVTIFGQPVKVNAKITAIGAFSAHGDQNKLTRWLHPTDGQIPKEIFLVHGDPESKAQFATHLRHELRTEVVIPAFRSSFEL